MENNSNKNSNKPPINNNEVNGQVKRNDGIPIRKIPSNNPPQQKPYNQNPQQRPSIPSNTPQVQPKRPPQNMDPSRPIRRPPPPPPTTIHGQNQLPKTDIKKSIPSTPIHSDGLTRTDINIVRKQSISPPLTQIQKKTDTGKKAENFNDTRIISKEYGKNDGGNTLPSIIKALIYIVSIIVLSIFLSYSIITIGNDIFAFVKPTDEIDLTIPEYVTTKEIANILKENKLIKFPAIFELYATYRKDNGKYIAGSYKVSPSMNYDELRRIFKPSTELEEVLVTIPEGYTIDEIIDIFVSLGMGTRDKFIDVIQNGNFDYRFVKELDNLSVDRKYRLEGYLFPDTYYFYKNSSEETIINKLLANFDEKFDSSYYDRATDLNMTVDDIIILASMIEKEAKLVNEYEIVSSVFHNRLKSSAYPKLESDATIQYGLGKRKAELNHSDTELQHPYNTYIYKGLPPGAIANPGLEAISGALYPIESGYYFFVAKPDGTSIFSKTNAEHEQAIREIRAETESAKEEK